VHWPIVDGAGRHAGGGGQGQGQEGQRLMTWQVTWRVVPRW
jgi:hypothetical protein